MGYSSTTTTRHHSWQQATGRLATARVAILGYTALLQHNQLVEGM